MRLRLLPLFLFATLAVVSTATPPEKPAVSIRVSSERHFFVSYVTGQDTRLRLSPNVIIKNEHVDDLVVALKTDGNWREQVAFAKLEIRDEDGNVCRAEPVSNQPIEAKSMAVLRSGEEQVFALPNEYYATLPRPGRYQIVVAVAFGSLNPGSKQVFVSSAPFEIAVSAKSKSP